MSKRPQDLGALIYQIVGVGGVGGVGGVSGHDRWSQELASPF